MDETPKIFCARCGLNEADEACPGVGDEGNICANCQRAAELCACNGHVFVNDEETGKSACEHCRLPEA